MATHPLRPIAAGLGLAAALVSFAITPASAATRITYGPLVPTPQVNVIDTSAAAGTCPIPDSDARVTEAYPSQWLKTLAAQSSHASARLSLDLDSQGNLLQAKVVSSSGNPILDDQALVAARGSKYAPEVRNCNSFKRSYFLDISFDTAMISLPTFGTSGHRQVL
jgi:TonB family protein